MEKKGHDARATAAFCVQKSDLTTKGVLKVQSTALKHALCVNEPYYIESHVSRSHLPYAPLFERRYRRSWNTRAFL